MKINELIEQIYKNPKNFNFKNAIFEHIKSKDYVPYFEDNSLRDEISKLISDKNDELIIKKCYEILKNKVFDIESHALISMSALKLQKPELSQLHNYIASSLLDLILKSGDGKDYHTAYKIVYPEDQAAVFTYFRKYPIERVNHEKYGKCIDIYTFEDKTNMFFDISIPFTAVSGYVENEWT